MAVMDYRTRDRIDDYGFSIEFQAEKGWQVYIVFQPFRHGQDDSPCLPYQAIDDNGRRYIDWPGRLDSLGDARTVAELWAELVQRYWHVQEQRALYAELIERYQRAQEQRKVAPSHRDRRGDTVDASSPGSEQCDCFPAIHARAATAPV